LNILRGRRLRDLVLLETELIDSVPHGLFQLSGCGKIVFFGPDGTHARKTFTADANKSTTLMLKVIFVLDSLSGQGDLEGF
jgi:hypothetical protein